MSNEKKHQPVTFPFTSKSSSGLPPPLASSDERKIDPPRGIATRSEGGRCIEPSPARIRIPTRRIHVHGCLGDLTAHLPRCPTPASATTPGPRRPKREGPPSKYLTWQSSRSRQATAMYCRCLLRELPDRPLVRSLKNSLADRIDRWPPQPAHRRTQQDTRPPRPRCPRPQPTAPLSAAHTPRPRTRFAKSPPRPGSG